MTGWYLMHRGWQDSLIFDGDEFSRRDAWVWMIEQAAYKAKSVRVGTSTINIERGQFTASIRFMAQAFGWHRNRVSRFLDQLRNAEMIGTDCGTEGGTGQLVITISKYEEFQLSLDDSGTPSGTGSGTPAGQNRKKETSSKNKEPEGSSKREREQTAELAFVLPPDIPTDEWNAFVDMRKRIKKPMTDHAKGLAVKELRKLATQGHDPPDVLNQSILNSWQGLFALKEQRNGRANSYRDGRSAWVNDAGTGLGGVGDDNGFLNF